MATERWWVLDAIETYAALKKLDLSDLIATIEEQTDWDKISTPHWEFSHDEVVEIRYLDHRWSIGLVGVGATQWIRADMVVLQSEGEQCLAVSFS